MGMNRSSFAPNEWYHCFTRGVDKRQTFVDDADYQRFHELLYLCNNTTAVHRSNLKRGTNVFEISRNDPLVHIGAYCLMPNHFHLLLQEIDGTGISTFMRKLGTGYAMYFNKRYERVGNLFVKPFRSRHVADDIYARQVSAYIHLNPLDIYRPKWEKDAVSLDHAQAENFLSTYHFSSFIDYLSPHSRAESAILAPEATALFSSYQQNLSFPALIEHALDFLSR
jgi:putative transposase